MKGVATIRPNVTLLTTLLILVLVPFVTADDLKPEIAEALDAGDTATAIELINQEIEIDKGYHLNYYTLGMIYFNQERWERALEQFEIAVDKKGNHWESVYHKGLTLIRLGRLDEAEEVMSRGQKKAKKEKHLFDNGLGLVKMAKGEYRDADLAFRQALTGYECAEYHINLGDANFYQSIPSLAVLEYEKALELDTASLEVYYHWAEACLEMRDYNCAMEQLQVVLSKDSTHAPAWMRAGGIYYKAARSSASAEDRKARYERTIGSYRRYLGLSGARPDSTTVRVYFELAMSYLALNGFEDAAEMFAKVLAIPVEAKDIYFYYGKALWGTQDYVKAGEMLQKHTEWVDQQPADFRTGVRDAELYQLMGDSYYYRKPNDFAEAALWYKKALDQGVESKRIIQNVAVAYHSLKNYPEAIKFYDRRIEMGIDERSASIYKNAGYCALNIANSQMAAEEDGDIDALDELEEEEEGGEEIASTGIDPTLNYYDVAVDYMENYLQYEPEDTKVLLLCGNTSLFQLSDCARGVKHLTNLLAVDATDCVAKKSLGYAYFGGVCTKNYGKALRYLRDAYTCMTSESGACADVDLVLWIAQCYHLNAAAKAEAKEDANDDFKNAYEWYGKVLKCEPGNAEAKKGQDDTRFEFVDG